jgi:putative transposase
VSVKREIVAEMMARGVAERAACRAVGLSRSSQRYQPRAPRDRTQLVAAVRALAEQHRRYGYRRITALLRRRGECVNHKRVWAIWKEEGLSLPRRRPRKRRGQTAVERPTRATHRNHVWTYDFLFDRTERGQTLKLLAVLDEYTRECHAIRVGRRLDSSAVRDTLRELFGQHGAPAYLRSDNGGEFIAARLQAWLERRGTATVHIEPGHPWENGYAESFNARLRDELLDGEIFYTLREAQIVIESWRRHYNAVRPHASLGYRAPAPEVFVPALAAWPAAQPRPAPPAMLPVAPRPTLN